jgi:hypothetical protein
MNPMCQNGSSLITHAALTLGYVTKSKSEPKALLLSTRSAPVRKSRLFQATCSWAYTPSVLFLMKSWAVVRFRAVALTVVGPGPGKSSPEAVMLVI